MRGVNMGCYVPKMGTQKIQKGPTAERVRTNIAALREDRKLTVAQLAGRMGKLGRPMQPSAVSKVEQGDRRVDVDDLVAFALALEVNPNVLLMPLDDGPATVEVTPNLAVPWYALWRWASGEGPLNHWSGEALVDGAARTEAGAYKLSELVRWVELARPHKTEDERFAESQALTKLRMENRHQQSQGRGE